MNKKFVLTLSMLFALAFAFSANAAIFPNRDLIVPDSPFYFLQTWKESIQMFFTFNAENKAKQYLHLAEVRLAEYQKMIEKNKTEIAEKILDKYEKQLNHALEKAEELKNKGKDMADLNEKIEQTVSKHLEVLRENLQKVPEQAKKGIENAIENSQKQIEKITGKKACTQEAKQCPDGSYVSRTRSNCEFAPCPEEKEICKNLCGDGVCQEIVCMAIGCPCPETKESCPKDCVLPESCLSVESQTTILNLAKFLRAKNKEKALGCFINSSKNQEVIMGLDDARMERLANYFEKAQVKEIKQNYIVYESEMEIPNGIKIMVKFIMTKDTLGQWIISSW